MNYVHGSTKTMANNKPCMLSAAHIHITSSAAGSYFNFAWDHMKFDSIKHHQPPINHQVTIIPPITHHFTINQPSIKTIN